MLLQENIKNALISVSDKKKIVKIAKVLVDNHVNIFSSTGTSNFLHKNNIEAQKISEYTKFPEIMNGRVKTLHPKIMGGILRRNDQDQEIMNLYNIHPIDLVIVNFYPFKKIQHLKNKTLDEILDSIDIGGPTLIRAAAKNYKNVIVIVDFSDFKYITNAMQNHSISIETRFHLASKAFQYTLSYEKIISEYFLSKDIFHKKNDLFPKKINFSFIKKQDLRYGENQHQRASFYTEKNILNSGTISSSLQIQGKTLSYNNICDADTALECVKTFIKPTCVIVKHGNPCGVAVNDNLIQSYLSAYHADPVSAFGGIIAFNTELNEETADEIIKKQFVEVIIAPQIHSLALKKLQKKQNIRILIVGKIKDNEKRLDLKRVTDGLLVQEYDSCKIDYEKWDFVTQRHPTKKELQDCIFCWKVAKFVKSNAIVYGKNEVTISIGAGQMSRIDSTKLANIKVKNKAYNIIGATMASDAFFPFRDGIDSAASVGIKCIIQPGGSIRDKEVIQSANEHNITMIFTKTRHFKH